MSKIHIKIADSGWILEKCASEIIKLDSKITYGLEDDPNATLQYYVNYSARKKRVVPIEVGFFTHSEKDESARNRFIRNAKEVDQCICMSSMYKKELKNEGVENVVVIPPGVDLMKFKPNIKIGIVGRTYHTGRKGESIISRVMDIPGIEWRFTGSGWPGEAYNVPDEKMPEFYNDLDYVLVPALYEGGPMSVVEGLACGIPIISSDVGWVRNFPHIEFENGNPDSLRVVLEKLVHERRELRKSALDYSWDNWAEKHIILFDKLLSEYKSSNDISKTKGKVLLITHGSEKKSLGGPSVRVPATAKALFNQGIKGEYVKNNKISFSDSKIAHIFNIWHPDSCVEKMYSSKASGKKVVFSPIFLNLSNHAFFSQELPGFFQNYSDLDKNLKYADERIRYEPNLPIREIFPGYHSQVAACTNLADHVVCLSKYEVKCLKHIGALPKNYSVVENPVDSNRFDRADADLFKSKYNIDEYILCVGRIEPRKNQLMVAEAAKRLGKKVVFIGHEGNPNYARLVKKYAGDYGVFIPRIDPQDPLLGSAFSGASVFTLPSWSEGAPLAALEAASTGVPLVLSDRSSEEEYFGKFADYVRPSDLNGLCEKLEKSIGRGRSSAQKEYIDINFNWTKHAKETASIYRALNVRDEKVNVFTLNEKSNERKIYFDITDYVYAKGKPSGIPRVVEKSYQVFKRSFSDRANFICWRRTDNSFIMLEPDEVENNDIIENIESLNIKNKNNLCETGFVGNNNDNFLLSFGGAWTGHDGYCQGLKRIKYATKSKFILMVHDLVRYKLSHLYPKEVADKFEKNALNIFSHVDHFITYSKSTSDDLVDFIKDNDFDEKKILPAKLGDWTSATDRAGEYVSDLVDKYSEKEFVIFVSSFDKRKNHSLLLNVWERLIKERGDRTPILIFVGRVMWPNDPVVDILSRNDELAGYIHHLSDVDDSGLDWLYKNCLFTVFPSLYEGWGLPVSESLAYNKLCLTSNTSSTAEISPYLTELLDPYDFKAWLDCARIYLENRDLLRTREDLIRKRFKIYEWERSIKDIVCHLDKLPFDGFSPPVLLPSKSLTFERSLGNLSAQKSLNRGWSHIESSGVWSTQLNSTISFYYLGRIDKAKLKINVSFLSIGSKINNQRVSVYLNGNMALCLNTSDIKNRVLTLDFALSDFISNSEDLKGSELIIDIEVDRLLNPKELKGSPDDRSLGVMVRSIVVDENSLSYMCENRLSDKEKESEKVINVSALEDLFSGSFEELQEKNKQRLIEITSIVRLNRKPNEDDYKKLLCLYDESASIQDFIRSVE